MTKNAKNYKDLTKGIASGYIYRAFETTEDTFFETLDIIYCAFAIADKTANLTGDIFFRNIEKYIMPKANKCGCYVILSIAPESNWEAIACDEKLILKFADNIVDVINKYGFDGVDLDWEYPKTGQYEWFTALAEKVYKKVKDNNPSHLVTAAITGGMWQVRYYDLLNSGKYLDYINMMTYSLSSNQGFYQSALYQKNTYDDLTNLVGKTNETCSIAESVEIFNNIYKIPYRKMIIGIPFYGARQIRTLNETNKTWSIWKSPGTLFYTDIKNKYLTNNDFKYIFDEIAKVPYLIKNDGTEFISYDDSSSIRFKCEYILKEKLGGIMFWEYGCDLSGDLLKAIKNGMKK